MGDGFFAAKAARVRLEHDAGRDYEVSDDDLIRWEIGDLERAGLARVDGTLGDGSVCIVIHSDGHRLHLRPLAVIRGMAALIGNGCSNREWANRCGPYPANISHGERVAIVRAERSGNYAENAAVVVDRMNAERAARLDDLRTRAALEGSDA